MTDDEYDKLKVFLGIFYQSFMAKPYDKPESHPLVVLARIEQKSRSQAKSGLTSAINDCIALSNDWTPESVTAADHLMRAENAPSLSEVRAKYSRKYRQILKRGSIKSETEYYLIKGVLDGGAVELGSNEAVQLDAMLSDFENRLSFKADKGSGSIR